VTEGISLLDRLQELIEGTYDWQTGIGDLSQYVLGDGGYRTIFSGRKIQEEAPTSETGPRTLVSWGNGPIRLSIYYPNSLVQHLESINPLREVSDNNIVAFSHLVEELDHLLRLAWSANHGRQVRLLELEFHANVTKYFVIAHFLGRGTRRRQLTSEQRVWLLQSLFLHAGEGLPEPLKARYRTAARLASRLIQRMQRLSPAQRILVLRRFARRPWEAQRRYLESVSDQSDSGLLLAF
jgi:hypothetical protein